MQRIMQRNNRFSFPDNGNAQPHLDAGHANSWYNSDRLLAASSPLKPDQPPSQQFTMDMSIMIPFLQLLDVDSDDASSAEWASLSKSSTQDEIDDDDHRQYGHHEEQTTDDELYKFLQDVIFDPEDGTPRTSTHDSLQRQTRSSSRAATAASQGPDLDVYRSHAPTVGVLNRAGPGSARRPPHGVAIAVQPTDLDVCCHRGAYTNNHVGSQNFRQYVQSQLSVHARLGNRDKMRLSRQIRDQVFRRGGRFLEMDEQDNWIEILDLSRAREKVAQCFRTLKRQMRRSNA